jgi:hypothetical protein
MFWLVLLRPLGQPLAWDKIDYVDAGYRQDQPAPWYLASGDATNGFANTSATTAMILTLIGVRLFLVTSWRRLKSNKYTTPSSFGDHRMNLPDRVVNENPSTYICATSSTKQVVSDIVRIVSGHPTVQEWQTREETMLRSDEWDPRYNPSVPICIDSKPLQVRL